MSATLTTPAPSAHVHLHSSIPSHLSAELALLQTFIRRSAAQHRTQLFLQRMEGVLRMGKLLLAYVKQNGARNGAEGTKDAEKWRWRGECLVRKMITMLYSAQHIASQIIDLRHFVPLQTTAVAIYARLFTIALNLAAGLGMDIGELVVSAGGDRLHKSSSSSVETPSAAMGAAGAKGEVGKMDLGDELGERIERSSLPLASAPTPSTATVSKLSSDRASRSTTPSLPKASQPLLPPPAAAAPSPQAVPLSEGISDGEVAARLLKKKAKAKRTGGEEVGDRKGDAGDDALEAVAPKKKKNAKLVVSDDVVPHRTETADGGAEKAEVAPKKKKKRSGDGEGDGGKSEVAKVKKKKKKDAMDDIFGF
ncbi:hypothetical protein IAT38_007479 [Cryptococcus sp. DSM 104549]